MGVNASIHDDYWFFIMSSWGKIPFELIVRKTTKYHASTHLPPMTPASHFILYVTDQERSTLFYTRVLDLMPRLHTPGMTEFDLPGGGVLGIMPEQGIRSLLGDVLPDPALAHGTPRAELYLLLDDPGVFHARALAAGATELSPLLPRDWGHLAAYSLDPDAHVLAFASSGVQR